MAIDASGYTATELYKELIWKIDMEGEDEPSRNGDVVTIQRPVTAALWNPQNRVLFARKRKPNHVFHVMEAIWMLAGENNVEWLLPFNSNISKYTEDNVMHGAYGHRWRNHWGFNQLLTIRDVLIRDPFSRQAVLSMWDAPEDLGFHRHKDRPCNTHIYFRVVNDQLDMHVLNRSNDFFWGMMGSNVVHFTMLHEVMAAMVGKDLGTYYVTTNNLHVYRNYPNLDEVHREAMFAETEIRPQPIPLIMGLERGEDFIMDCQDFVGGVPEKELRTFWMRNVAHPMKLWYLTKYYREDLIEAVKCPMWEAGLRMFNGEL